jgi:hypothetical protein
VCVCVCARAARVVSGGSVCICCKIYIAAVFSFAFIDFPRLSVILTLNGILLELISLDIRRYCCNRRGYKTTDVCLPAG